MKKFVATIIVVVMLFANLSVLANNEGADIVGTEDFVSVKALSSVDSCLVGETFNVTISLCDISLEDGDGISLFSFVLAYDKSAVTPVAVAPEDSDMDYSFLLKSSPLDSWSVLGKLDDEKGEYDFAVSAGYINITSEQLVTEDDSLVVEIPFTVNDGVEGRDIVFSFEFVEVYNSDLLNGCYPSVEDVVVSCVAQPDVSDKEDSSKPSFPDESTSADVSVESDEPDESSEPVIDETSNETPAVPTPDDSVDEIILGDVNSDATVDQYDYLLVKRYYFGTFDLDETQMKCADVNSDKTVNQYDYLLIKRVHFGTYVL